MALYSLRKIKLKICYKTLVAGGAGSIGSHICIRLVHEKHQVVVIDNLSNGSLDNLKELKDTLQFSFHEFDVNNTIKLRLVFDSQPFDNVRQSMPM